MGKAICFNITISLDSKDEYNNIFQLIIQESSLSELETDRLEDNSAVFLLPEKMRLDRQDDFNLGNKIMIDYMTEGWNEYTGEPDYEGFLLHFGSHEPTLNGKRLVSLSQFFENLHDEIQREVEKEDIDFMAGIYTT